MAALKKPKEPRYKALPKAPKMKASTEAWKTYESRVKSVTAENMKLKAEYEKQLKAYDSEMKKRESIKAKAKIAKSRL